MEEEATELNWKTNYSTIYI